MSSKARHFWNSICHHFSQVKSANRFIIWFIFHFSIELWSTISLFLEGQKLFLWIIVLGSLIKKWILELTGDSREKLGKLLAFLHGFPKKYISLNSTISFWKEKKRFYRHFNFKNNYIWLLIFWILCCFFPDFENTFPYLN